MTIPMEIVIWALGIMATVILTLMAYILKQITSQMSAMAVLNGRVLAIEQDQARMWGIYDAWKGPSAPSGVDRIAARYGSRTEQGAT